MEYNKKIHPVDIHVGNRVRTRRAIMGFSQTDLGDTLGVSFQQIQKYEKGTNRIGASRLYEIANILKVNIQYFYADMVDTQLPHHQADTVEEVDIISKFSTSESKQLCKSFFDIQDSRVKRRLLDLIDTLAKESKIEVTKSKIK